MTITKTGRRVAFLGLLALVVAILPLTAASAQDEEAAAYIDFDINEEVEASDALQTSILASQQAFPDGTDTVLLTTSEDGADALVSGVLANDAALLYYNSDEGVVDAHVEEITRLGATEVIIIGGEERIDGDVETALTDMGLNVTRLAGDERISTANEVLAYAEDNRDDFNETASHLSRAFGTDDNSQTAFADAVGLGAWDAQGGAGTVLAPSDADVLSEDYPTTQYFTDVNPENETIVPIGGEAAVPAGVVDYLTGEPAEQTAGDRVENEDANNRAGTAVAINEARGLDAGDLAGVVVVDAFADNFFIDAYATSALAGNNDYAVVVSNGDELSPETAEWLGSPAFAQNDGTTDVICMPKTSGEACAEAVTATGGDPEDIETVSLDSEETPQDNTGVVVSTTGDAPDYSYVADGSDSVTTVTTDAADDTFLVDGQEAASGIFFTNLTPGDTVTVTENEDGSSTHALENVDSSTIVSGTVGNVDTSATTFDIIEPVSGVALNTGIDYSGDLFTVDGTPATAVTFGNAINEGDTVSIDEDTPVDGTDTINLSNEAVSGLVTATDTTVATETLFTIGALGDYFGDAQDDDFEVIDGDTTQNLTIDGDEATFAEFTAEISVGDEITYSRDGGEENFQLGNAAPTVESGTASDVLAGTDNATNTVEYLPAGDDIVTTFTYADGATFLVNGVLSDVAAFEAALTEGDMVTYRAADAATSTTERVTLEDAALTGFVSATAVVVDGAAAGDTLTIDRDDNDGNATLFDAYALDMADGQFSGTVRYFVDGAEVAYDTPDTGFEAVLDDIDLDDAPEVVITQTALSVNIDLYPMGQDA